MKIVKCEKCDEYPYFRLEIGVTVLNVYGIEVTRCCFCDPSERKFAKLPVLSKEQFPKGTVESLEDYLKVTLEVLKAPVEVLWKC